MTRRRRSVRPTCALSCPACTIIGTSSAAERRGVGHGRARQRGQNAGGDDRHVAEAAPHVADTSPAPASTIRFDSPPTFITSPASMKNGTASSVKLSVPLSRFWARIWASKKSSCTIRATPHRRSARRRSASRAPWRRGATTKTRMVMARSSALLRRGGGERLLLAAPVRRAPSAARRTRSCSSDSLIMTSSSSLILPDRTRYRSCRMMSAAETPKTSPTP